MIKSDVRIAGKIFDESSFCFIAGGVYPMGINECNIPLQESRRLKREYFFASSPLHFRDVKEFAMSRFCVSVEEFSRFACKTRYRTDAEKEGWGWILRDGQWSKVEGLSWERPFGNEADELYRKEASRFPALQVSWNDANAYCRWLSDECGFSVNLPSEIQWEAWAHRAGFPSMIEQSAGENSFRAPEFFDDVAYLEALSASIGRNGVLSAGVLWEWCRDWYDAYPGGGLSKEYGKVYKVLRGGSLHSHPIQRTREYRFRRCPTARSAYYGFRIAVEGNEGTT